MQVEIIFVYIIMDQFSNQDNRQFLQLFLSPHYQKQLLQLNQQNNVKNKFIKASQLLNKKLTITKIQIKMHNSSTKTPDNTPQQYKWQINTSESINNNNEDCPYCLMKRKFNIGSSGDQRCFEHSIKVNLQHTKLDDSCLVDSDAPVGVDEMVQMLEDVEAGLDYYWGNLREVSGGNGCHVQRDLEPVLACVKRVQDKIGRFFYDNPIDLSQIKPVSSHTSLNKKLPNTGSQKYLRVQLSNIFDPDDQPATQSIKEWVMYFNKLVQLRQIPDHDPLPHQSEIEMRIFKQSMERKFMFYVEQLQGYQKKVKDVLTKLIFYMEKSTDQVSERQIEQDIMFIEGQHTSIYGRESELERLLVVQATSMESMLFGANIYG